MKIMKWQRWRNITHGGEGKFKFWSGLVKVEGDKTLEKGCPMKNWKRAIVLGPVGDSKVRFSMGFKAIDGTTKISTATRRIEDGLFCMRLGPDDCEFFIASNDGRVYLGDPVDCFNIIGKEDKDPDTSKLCLY